jgi:hypothetical protein
MQTIEDVPQCVAGVHALPTAVGSQLVAISRSRDLAVAGQSAASCALGGKGGWLW